MTKEALKLRADNNLAALPVAESGMVVKLVTGPISNAREYCRHLSDPDPRHVKMLEVALDLEKSGQRRDSLITLITSTLKKASMPKTPTAPVEVLGSEVMLSGPEANALSPQQSALAAAVETATGEARRLADLVKNYGRAGTAAKTLCGIHLRQIREFYFGPRNPNGGRPKKTPNVSAFSTWEEFLADRIGITRDTGENWMKMADAVEALAESKGLDLPTICQKLPWDWTPEEAAAIDATVHKLTQDKTQRDLLQSDFLASLGYEAPERINGSNNPTGANGGKKAPASSPQEKVEGIRLLARTALFGHDSKEHRPKPGSPAFWMNALVDAEGKGELHKHPLAALTKKERADIYDLLIQPFVSAFKALDQSL